jgi:CheY-like chemotaxis protein
MRALSRDHNRPGARDAILPARVLVVDDDPLTCELICEVLRSAEFEAASLTDSAEAAERLRREKFHAVFLDLRMPPPDGLELARQIRASRPNASAVIVMISGDEERSAGRQAFEAGVEFFLFKPVERNKLLKLIRAARGAIERERQRCARLMLRCRVSLESNSDRIDGATVDLSLGGALVESTRALAPGTRGHHHPRTRGRQAAPALRRAGHSRRRNRAHEHSVRKPRGRRAPAAARLPPAVNSRRMRWPAHRRSRWCTKRGGHLFVLVFIFK